ncbi:hypothetical protein [Niastella populi]|uniref:Lipoprotein n=1 Tax=Niastella populi TaxID=550983 RepID=A0A1V9GBA8_9BACT|nr:hypothetical protein [Niastella populi]OQP67844.1 hypothetical protein A4R26_32555 [Niastella populi]
MPPYIYRIFLVISVAILSCTIKNRKELVKKSKNEYLQGDVFFKDWLKDTLKVIESFKGEYKEKALKYEVAEDSLQLDILEGYQFVFNKAYKSPDKNIKYIIGLLKEYSEQPALPSIIRFTVHHTYYPSVTEGLKNEFVEELEDISVKSKDTLIEYGYIRGRLSNKYVTVKSSGKPKLHCEFVWENNKLLKKAVGD